MGLEDVSKYPLLLAEVLKDSRWSEEDVAKLAGGNLLRVLRRAEQVRQMRKEGKGGKDEEREGGMRKEMGIRVRKKGIKFRERE